MSSFHSLPTGKSFRTCLAVGSTPLSKEVSIPFQRESPFGLEIAAKEQHSQRFVSIPFQRESPFGRECRVDTWHVSNVSIPFQRESPFGQVYNERKKFEFNVSIPFKRESPFGQAAGFDAYFPHDVDLLVSIPFKRESPFGQAERSALLAEYSIEFPFPSNGKVLSD